MLIKLTAPTRVNLPAGTIVDVSADEAFRLKVFGVGVECEPETPAASGKMVETGTEATEEKPKRATKKKKA